ncbi:Mov34/MPN/PAD-1 family protein [Methanopyrus sp.]
MPGVKKIEFDAELLGYLLEASDKNHPNEFFAMLGGSIDAEIVTIDSIIVVPFESSDSGAIFDLLSVHTRDVVGTFHSHPYGDPVPSEDDLMLFKRLGVIHAIAAYPYTPDRVEFYGKSGKNITPVVEVRYVADEEANNR